MQPVADSEIDWGKHRTYFAVVAAHSDPVGAAMLEMSRAAAIAGRTLAAADLATAAEATEKVSDSASTFLREVSGVQCPEYVRGAHDQLVDALQRVIRAGQAGAAAVDAQSATRIVGAGDEIKTATDDFMAVAHRFADWRSGAGRG